jgi:hypothetical protein
MDADGQQWARIENNMARMGHDGCGQLVIGADGSQWARATL